ncbi:MAG TPA: type II toxin-antitoxin system RelE/ParE family toxin [Chthoniobacteraceae bacterium]|jgi:toxin ParE1/3/4|nr:type II toxin-antitoxin system RelE/ParE family toxin [Chthoniobacteraceae bacterium]
MKLDFTEAAIEDLRLIREYTVQKWGERQEDAYLDRLWNRFEKISADPSIHRFRHDLFPDCQLAAEGRHVILFRIRKDVLQVIRVLHSAMDFKSHLPEESE